MNRNYFLLFKTLKGEKKLNFKKTTTLTQNILRD